MKIKNYIVINILIVFMWLIMIEQISISQFIFGLFISHISMYLTHKMLHYPLLSLPISFVSLSKYFFILFFSIYKGGIEQIIRLFKQQVNPILISVKTELKNEFNIVLLANSITLTPGTITVERQDQNLLILSVEDVSEEDIKGKLERILKENDL